MTATRDLLIEIGTEEMPPKALNSLGTSFAKVVFETLNRQNLLASNASYECYFSPRRLAIIISHALEQAPNSNVSQKLMPRKIAFDENGSATSALKKKLEKEDISENKIPGLPVKFDGKAEYVFYEYLKTGIMLRSGLNEALADSLLKLPIPKRMRWGENTAEFVRPVHWVVVLFGEDVIDCDIFGVRSDRFTRGHRFHFPGPVRLESPADYLQTLRQHRVWLNDAAHGLQEEISRQAHQLAGEINGAPLNSDPESPLVAEIAALVEWPVAIRGEFDPEFLQLPEEILIATLEDQQRYFPLRDQKTGRLLPAFITIANIESHNPATVRKGNERVIIPRLTDAMFFWESDRAGSLENRMAELNGIVYQKKLGSIGDKSRRVRGLSAAISQSLNIDPASAERAAQLAKCDLVTTLVGEFPELQGVIGKYLAINDGEADDVAQAIEEHYLPRFAGDRLPESATGQVLALADKLDTLTGIFGIGQQPTGDKDPFALRRAALGIIRIIIEKKLPLSLNDLVESAFAQHDKDIAEAHTDVCTFIYERVRNYFIDKGYTALETDAVFCLRPDRLDMVPAQLEAVRNFNTLVEAASLSAANKRIGNILKKSGTVPSSFSRELLAEDAEKLLAEEYLRIAPKIENLHQKQDFTGMLQQLAVLKEPVDQFFDTVMVMTDDQKLRDNRIGLLKELHSLMNRIADLSRLAA